VAGVLDDWSSNKPESLPTYATGSDGPAEADALLARDGRSWRAIQEPAR
jgi:glucose-6-phosphate 1-dehydrogenase